MNLFMISLLLSIISADTGTAAFPLEFRTVNSIDNNTSHGSWGAAGIYFQRLTAPSFSSDNLPNPRVVSNTLFSQNTSIKEPSISSFLWAWAEFIFSDMVCLSETYPPEPFNIEIPENDPFFTVSATSNKSISYNKTAYIVFREGVHQQINKASSYIDGSMIYGNEKVQADFLRVNDGSGRLKAFTITDLITSIRSTYTLHELAVAALRMLFIKEHNYWCSVISSLKSDLSDDQIYNQAKAMVVAQLQAITYREFLPALLGPSALPVYNGYNPSINPTISNEFSQGFDILIQSLVSTDTIHMPPLGDPQSASSINDFMIESVFKALGAKNSERLDLYIVDELRNSYRDSLSYDASAVSLQRTRDHRLPLYNDFRAALGLATVDDLCSVTSEPLFRSRIASVYPSCDKMELFPVALAENHLLGAQVGVTLFRLLKRQFQKLRDGDRFYYERYMSQTIVQIIEKRTLSKIICDNTNISTDQIPVHAFYIDN